MLNEIFSISYRFLVHRYSVLRDHVDTAGDEHLDSNISTTQRSGGYHDDSDEVAYGVKLTIDLCEVKALFFPFY